MKVKICGITSLEDAQAAVRAGADLLGFNFYPASPRYISPQACRAIAEVLRPTGVCLVGVFVNAGVEEVRSTLAECGLHLAQLSGDEPPEVLAELGGLAFKALRPADSQALDGMLARYPARASAPAWLLDAARPGEFGGTGQSADWRLAAGLAARAPLLLAGGLKPENVAAAVRQVRPWGVDVASGVESTTGRKDFHKMVEFIQAARRADLAAEPASAPRAGKYGPYGGQFAPEVLMPALAELEEAYAAAQSDAAFQAEFERLLAEYVGRPTPLSYAARLSEALGGARIYLKREDLAHTGAHKINNALGQALLARRMGKRRIVAETGAGQHGVASATAAALLGLECVVYMGEVDIARQQPNVQRMRLLGAEVRPVQSGSRTLKDAVNEAIRDWVANVGGTYYLLGSALGPHPYPAMVRDFQSVIGREARAQILAQAGRLPDACIACVGGGSNAIGLFQAFRADPGVALVGVEAGGEGLATGRHAARFGDPRKGRPGVLHGTFTYLLQDADGQVAQTHSISAGLDYPAVGPEHAFLHDSGRAEYTSAEDGEALAAFQMLARTEGILPALESAHAVAEAVRRAPKMSRGSILLVNLSGRGDKDLDTVLGLLDRQTGGAQ